MGAERGERLRQRRVFLPQERGFGLLGRIETWRGHRLTIVKVRPPVPGSLLNAHQVVRVVEWISAATYVSTVEGRPQLVVGVELQPEGVSQTGGDELEIGSIGIEPDDRPAALHVAFDYFAWCARCAEWL